MMFRLRNEARQAGGDCIYLLGNHEFLNLIQDYRYVSWMDLASFVGKRRFAFSQQGWIGKELRKLQVSALVHGTVFVHGGITEEWASLGVDGINKQARRFLKNDTKSQLSTRKILVSEEGPLWFRGYAQEDEYTVCPKLKKVLDLLGAKRMVMSHTITPDHRINVRCQGKAILIDTAISSAIHGGRISALELSNTHTRAIYQHKIVHLNPSI
ncbi:hypothetical protein DSO57_1017448 [Entomophthora muscae]|uniref:Uncharacterized protein n=1 Tax=Entomophthora muscae TaxID=34485 RepID=A0ACC2RJ80_9FUNG|nr:hypothetical protein DSO57_1017448 [Entomophthora muscae]